MTRVELAVAEPLETRSLLRVLAAHAVPGLEEVDPRAGTVRRLVTPGGRPALLTLTLRAQVRRGTPSPVGLSVEGGRDLAEPVTRLVRRWLDLDTDLAEVRSVLAPDPRLAPLVAARPGLRVTGYPDGFEGAVLTVLGQQVSVAAARTVAGRLLRRYAVPHPGTGLCLFPAPQVLAVADVDELRAVLGVPGARARSVVALARACADGLAVGPRADHREVRAALLALPGIGPWTVDYLAVRALADPDAFPATDLVLRRALGGLTSSEATRAAAAWSPYRAYATAHLWAGEAYS